MHGITYFVFLSKPFMAILNSVVKIIAGYLFIYPGHPLFQGVSHVLLTNL